MHVRDDLTTAFFAEHFRNREPISYSRWGDCEWKAVLGYKGVTCDGHPYYPGMCQELREVLQGHPRYLLGIQRLARRMFRGGKDIDDWLIAHNLQDTVWHEAEVLHDAAFHGEFAQLAEAIRSAPGFAVVGPEHFNALGRYLPISLFVLTPSHDVYNSCKQITWKLRQQLRSLPDGSVVSVSAGMPGRLIVDWLYPEFGQRLHLIDFGSVWEPFVGRAIRGYQHERPQAFWDAQLSIQKDCDRGEV